MNTRSTATADGPARRAVSVEILSLSLSSNNAHNNEHHRAWLVNCCRNKLYTTWLEQSLTPHSTQYRSFRRRSSQPITWLILTNKTVAYRKIQINKLNTNQKKVDNLKYSKTKLHWFSCLLQHSARKQDGLILQRSRAHTGRCIQQIQTKSK